MLNLTSTVGLFCWSWSAHIVLLSVLKVREELTVSQVLVCGWQAGMLHVCLVLQKMIFGEHSSFNMTSFTAVWHLTTPPFKNTPWKNVTWHYKNSNHNLMVVSFSGSVTWVFPYSTRVLGCSPTRNISMLGYTCNGTKWISNWNCINVVDSHANLLVVLLRSDMHDSIPDQIIIIFYSSD